MVKAWISWVVSMVLAFQPSAFALSKEQNTALNQFFEDTQLTKREVSLKEFYEKTKSVYPESVRKEMKALIDQNPSAKLPKIAVSKIKNAKGEEEVQLQFVHDGESAIVTIVGKDGVFAKVGKEVIRYEDMITVDKATKSFDKGISPSGRIATDRNPSSIPSSKPIFLKAKDLMKLDKNSQRKYYKNFRDLLETMEDIQQMSLPKKTSALEKSQIDMFVSLFVSEAHAADADVGKQCIVGGYVSTFAVHSATKKLSCGHGDAKIRQDCAGSDQVLCNPVVYGRGKGPKFCVLAGYDTTERCNAVVQDPKNGDIPDLVQTSAEFDALAKEAQDQAAKLKQVCVSNFENASASVKNKFNDQVATCARFDERIAIINTWPCSNPAFKSNSNYTRLCEAGGGGQHPPTTPPTDGGQHPPVPVPGSDPNNTCDPLIHLLPGDGRVCHPSQTTDGGSGFCMKDGKRVDGVQGCSCDNVFKPVGEPCGTGGGVVDRGPGRGKKPGFWKRNGRLLLGLAAGMVGIGVFYYLNKKARAEAPTQLEPNDPAPTPNNTPTTLPQERPGVS